MSKNIKVTYAVNTDKTCTVLAKDNCIVKDIIELIQKKEEDPEYKYLFYEGAQLTDTDNFADFYEQTVVYIATKTPDIPEDLLDYTETMKGHLEEEDKDKTVIGEDDAEDFVIPEPSDETPPVTDDDDDDRKSDTPEGKPFKMPPPPDVEPKPKPKPKPADKGKEKPFKMPPPPDVEPEPKPKPKPEDKGKGKPFKAPPPPDVEPKPKPKPKTRAGKKDEYTIHTTLSVESMRKGHKIDGIDKNMKLNDVKNVILKWIKKEEAFEDIIEDKNDIEVHLFLPCGIVFKSGTIKEWFDCLDYPAAHMLYAVVTRKLEGSEKTIIDNVCNCKSEEMKKLLSPLCKTTKEGYTQIASLLGFFYYGGSLPLAENLLRNLATITGFAPMITSIYNIMCRNKIDGFQIISITAALQTLISQSVVEADLKKSFSYTNLLLSYVNSIEMKDLPLPNLSIYNQKNPLNEEDDVLKYLKKYDHFNYIILWDKDLKIDDKKPFKVANAMKPLKVNKLMDSFNSEMSLKPVSPMTILYLHSVSFIRMQKEEDDANIKVGLFIRKVPQKDYKDNPRKVIFINPEKGKEEEIDYEEFANSIDDLSIDKNIKNKGDTSLQQIICVVLDTTRSMDTLLNGKRVAPKQLSRRKLSVIFLNTLMSRIHFYKIPTARGLVTFGEEINTKVEISVAEKNFEEELGKVTSGGSIAVFDAIGEAVKEIKKFNPYKKVKGEKQFKYPNARGRIILLSDADDTLTDYDPICKITQEMIDNEIVFDLIQISTVNNLSYSALTSAKLTGGLLFQPSNEREGIDIFETEAFLDIKARAACSPYEGEINEKEFMKQQKALGRNPFTKEIENRYVKQAKLANTLSSVDYTLFYRSLDGHQPKSICERYIMKQLHRIRKENQKEKDQQIVVYTFHNDLKKWRVFIKGPDRSYFEGGWWNLFINFPSNYPNSPPQFRFVSVPYHQNVSSEGLVMFTEISDEYDPAHKMPDILESIQKLLKRPDEQVILRESVANERKTDDEGYTRKAKACTTAMSKEDYHDFLVGVTVNEEIPEGGIIDDDEENGNSMFITLTDKEKHRIIDDDEDEEKYD